MKPGAAPALRLRFDEFELDEADARLKRGGKGVALPPKAFGVLCTLARQPGVLVTKNTLLDAVWGHQHVSESVLKTTISQLRAALADDAASPRYIQTASRLGYRFIAVAPRDERPAAATATGPVAPSEIFIGRGAALARLHESWRRAGEGQRQLVWVAGDAGVGKSTLLDNFIRLSGAAAIAQGQCVEQFGSGEPYLPVLQALGDLCRAYPDLAASMRVVAPTWLLQMPWLLNEAERGTLLRELAGAGQERMVREFHELMLRFTQNRPLLFVLEDLHWCDPSTLGLIDYFARQRTPSRMMWIGSFRLTQVIAEAHPLQQLRQELRLHRLCEEILLDPFSETEVQDYLRSRAPAAEASEAFVRRVHAHTDGLPLFVANVVDSLLGPETDISATGHKPLPLGANTPLPVPEDLTGAVEARIARLPAATVTLLEAAAVCGVEFRAGAVAEMPGRPVAEVIDACDQLVRQQFWLRHVDTIDLADGTLDSLYSFRHAIYRHVFYERLGAAARAHLHRRAAQVLGAGAARGVPSAPVELALHHERGREIVPALRAYTQAAQMALRSFTPQTAREICEHALTLLPQLPPGPERLMLELGVESTRGTAVGQLFGPGSAAALVVVERVRELCELLPQHPARAVLLNGYGAALFARAEYAKMEELAQRLDALQGPDRETLSVLTCIFHGMAATARGQCRAAGAWWQRAIAECEAITDRGRFDAFLVDPEVAIRAHALRAFHARGLIDLARRNAATALAQARALGQPLTQSLAHWQAGMLEARLGNPEEVIAHADAIREIVNTTSVSLGDGPSRYLRGWALAQSGQPRAGIELIREGLALHVAIGMTAYSTEVMGYAAEALILAGDWQAATRELADALARARELDEQACLPVLLVLQARVAHGMGDVAGAYRRLKDAVQAARALEAPAFELKAACEVAAHPAATSEDREALARLLDGFTEGLDTRDYRRGRALLN